MDGQTEIVVAQSRIPGPQGFNSRSDIDDGTLALAPSPPQGIDISSSHGGKQGVSRSRAIKRAQAYATNDGIVVAEIFFATNDDSVYNKDDTFALTKLIVSLKSLVKHDFKPELLCTGGADHRGTKKYNVALGQRRANSVKNYILSQVVSPNLTVHVKSIGESLAALAALAAEGLGQQKVTPNVLMKYRKVVVTLGRDALIPPVKISVTGNWILGKSIEVRELDNGAKTVVHPGDIGSISNKKESKRMGWTYDPILPVATVKSHYHLMTIGNSEEAVIRCDVVYNKTGQVLFSASAQTDSKIVIKQYLQYNPKYDRVKRVIDPKTQTPKSGYVIEETTVSGVNMRALHLFESIYAQLKGSYKNITEKVAVELKQP